ncbi:MAG: transposase [Candidatus Omnitrophota bacterium]
MPRNKRLHIPGAVNHVIVRGLEKRLLFLNDKDRFEFLGRLGNALNDTLCQCYAWVLMPNHIHLLIRTGIKSLTDLMRSLLTGYAIYFNRAHNRHGYLFQNRYKSILCQEDRYFAKLVSYIHLNPVRAKIIESVDELDYYPWSGHAAIIGTKKCPWQNTDEVLSRFKRNKQAARAAYRELLIEQAQKGFDENLTGGGLRRSAGGWHNIKLSRHKDSFWRGDERILGDSAFVEETLEISNEYLDGKFALQCSGWDINKLISHVCALYKIPPKELLKKGRSNELSAAKGLICYWGYCTLGISGADLSRYFNISRPAISKNIALGKNISEEQCLKLIS